MLDYIDSQIHTEGLVKFTESKLRVLQGDVMTQGGDIMIIGDISKYL